MKANKYANLGVASRGARTASKLAQAGVIVLLPWVARPATLLTFGNQHHPYKINYTPVEIAVNDFCD